MGEAFAPWPDETVEDLQRNGLFIFQKKTGFRYGMDAVLLADFAKLRKRDRVVDFGTGTGILPLLMSQNEPTARFDAFEIQPQMAEMARRSVAMNGLEERIIVHQADYRTAPELLGKGCVDLLVCNPPYGKQGGTLLCPDPGQSLARHEGDCTLAETIAAAAALLGYHGRLDMVFPAQRMLELMDALRACKLEPKRLRMVCGKVSKPPYLLLCEAVKFAREGLLWEAPLVVHDELGKETPEIRKIYHMEDELGEA